MPWDQTEELFKSTLKAVTESSADDDAWNAPAPKYETVDLGEAGRHEIWETGSARIEKLIAKHGGKQSPTHHREPRRWCTCGGLVARFGYLRSHLEIVDALASSTGCQSNLAESFSFVCCLLAHRFTSLSGCCNFQAERIPVFFKGIDTEEGFRTHKHNDFIPAASDTATNRSELTAFY